MSDYKSFRLFDANTGIPKPDATPTIVSFVDRGGAPRTPPGSGVVNLGDGLYRIQLSDADVTAGTAFLINTGVNVEPGYFSGTVYPPTQPFDALFFEDSSGILMTVGVPTVTDYLSMVNGAPVTPPTLIQVIASSFYLIVPSNNDLALGVAYSVTGQAGSINTYDGRFFTEGVPTVPVDIYALDESPSPVPIPNAEISIFDPTSGVLVGGAVTDSDGLASFSLVGSITPGTTYEVRAFKLGVNFHGLHTIMVTDPVIAGAPNKFDITGADTNILPVSGSPYLCRCTGVFVDFTGQPLVNKTIMFTAQAENNDKIPKIWNLPSRMVAPDVLQLTTDGNGRASVNLVRTGQYWVTFGGDDDTVWPIIVPDQYAANLIDLIHPFPVEWDWDQTAAPGNVVSVASGESVQVPLSVIFNDFEVKGTGLETFFDVINSDGTIVEVTYITSMGIVNLRGLSTGSANITPTLKTGIKPIRWPVPAVTAPALVVTVT